jgi:anthranilate 1,2-dioxygenase large subunit/terephthalate 1,2-dioxygenase oxygenase component alpha subunit
MIDKAAADASYKEQGLRSDTDKYRLKDTTVLQGFEEFDDGITLQILSVFPGFVLQQIQNCLAVRQVLPKGQERTELNWTYLGYVGDTPEQRKVRLKQLNLVGPAGFISMEDGAVGGFVQRGIAGAQGLEAVVEMGGEGTGSSDGRAIENSVRGFWKAWRQHMGV